MIGYLSELAPEHEWTSLRLAMEHLNCLICEHHGPIRCPCLGRPEFYSTIESNQLLANLDYPYLEVNICPLKATESTAPKARVNC